MRQLSARQFARKLKDLLKSSDRRFIFFIGSGCSVTSGIGDASTLVGRWLPKLKRFLEGSEDNYEQWAKKKYPEYNGNNKAVIYSKVMKELFATPAERQEEIERICGNNTPGFGYAVLAQLMNYKKYGSYCNVVLTTNFDDMVADALYVFTSEKPLVMVHESLVSFIKISRTRPMIIKLHGDALISPKNTEGEIVLEDEVKDTILNLLKETGLIFIGYGGNDSSIYDLFKDLPENALPWGIYWVGEQFPKNRLGKLLEARNTTHVNHFDFDELMLLLKKEFGLKRPDKNRFSKVFRKYFDKLQSLEDNISKRLDSPEKDALSEAAEDAVSELDEKYKFIFEALQHEKDNPDKADEIYLEGLDKFPKSVELLDSYAIFLTDIRKDYDNAEMNFKRSLEIDPKNERVLSNYALFLTKIRKNYDKSEEYYKHALEIDPDNSITLSNYANFLKTIRKDDDRAEKYYKRSLEIDPDNANTLNSYAVFLTDIRKDHDKAEEYYKRSLKIDPNDVFTLCNYANFQYRIKKDHNKAEEYYNRSLKIEPNDAITLCSLAALISDIRQDHDRAEEYLKRSLEIEPENASILGNYAGFLLSQGRAYEGFEYLDKAFKLCDIDDLELECRFYMYAHSKDGNKQKESLKKIKELIESDVRSRFWNLDANINRAIKDGHPQPEFLKALAKVISDELDVKELDKFDVWNTL